MASTDCYCAAKNSEAAFIATAAASAFTAVNSHRQTRLQEALLAEAQKAAEMAEATYDAQIESLHEQRRHNFAMWRQTPGGQAYEGWKDRVWSLINAVEARHQALLDAWAADEEELLSDEEIDIARSGIYVTPPKSMNVGLVFSVFGRWLLIATPIVLVGIFVVLLVSLLTVSISLIVPVITFVLGLIVVIVGKIVLFRLSGVEYRKRESRRVCVACQSHTTGVCSTARCPDTAGPLDI